MYIHACRSCIQIRKELETLSQFQHNLEDDNSDSWYSTPGIVSRRNKLLLLIYKTPSSLNPGFMLVPKSAVCCWE